MIRIRTRFFASHREALGIDRLEIELPDGSTVADLVDRIANQFPNVAAVVRLARYAVNRVYLPATTVLQAGDEVAFIPPVAGGGA
ncbi:MAG TPA: molybdopterin converting factor subunit 1 [Chloroflexota bacterium]|nr:molybdopterin converting factor subunit 1 [Chloroflexota bacterium]